MLAAWREFLRGKKKRKDVAEFSLRLMDNIFALHRELADQTYRHGGYLAFKINDPKPRDIHKASVRDRLVHHAIYRVIYPYFDRKFIFDSYSCRINKGTHKSMNRFREYGRIVSRENTRTVWVLKCDIRKFFASIDHQILKDILDRRIRNNKVKWLLGQIIDSFETTPTCVIPAQAGIQRDLNTDLDSRLRGNDNTKKGLPLGNLTSQLLVNIYLNEFDHFLKRKLRSRYCVRYADDFVILHQERRFLENLLPEIAVFLESRLKLSLHPDKVSIRTLASGVDFLGWAHFPQYRRLRTSTKCRMFRNLEQKKAESTVNSYLGMLSHGNAHKLAQKIELKKPEEFGIF